MSDDQKREKIRAYILANKGKTTKAVAFKFGVRSAMVQSIRDRMREEGLLAMMGPYLRRAPNGYTPLAWDNAKASRGQPWSPRCTDRRCAARLRAIGAVLCAECEAWTAHGFEDRKDYMLRRE